MVRHGGAYAFGDSPTLADCYLVPKSAAHGIMAAHPDRQPDADL